MTLPLEVESSVHGEILSRNRLQGLVNKFISHGHVHLACWYITVQLDFVDLTLHLALCWSRWILMITIPNVSWCGLS
jgi:hypothetical protein